MLSLRWSENLAGVAACHIQSMAGRRGQVNQRMLRYRIMLRLREDQVSAE